jgi:hypothetical protein
MLEYADRLSGFSYLFSNSHIERLESKLRVLRKRKLERRGVQEEEDEDEDEDGSSEGDGSESESGVDEEGRGRVPFWRTMKNGLTRRFGRRRKSSEGGRRQSASPPDA